MSCDLKWMMENGLPLNRKERYYTGTVLPAIICNENFKHIGLFLGLIGISNTKLTMDAGKENFQFFTEFALKDSLYNTTHRSAWEGINSNDTPDIVIFVNGTDRKKLVAIEAKLFEKPKLKTLQTQIEAQKIVLKTMQKHLGVLEEDLHHVLLLPDGFFCSKHLLELEEKCQAVSWNKIYKLYSEEFGDFYFLNILKYALENYCKMSSRGLNKTNGGHVKMSGHEIYKRFTNNTLKYKFMGRGGGLRGRALGDDILKGNWTSTCYSVSLSIGSKRNWFSIEQFVNRIKQEGNMD